MKCDQKGKIPKGITKWDWGIIVGKKREDNKVKVGWKSANKPGNL